MKYECRECGKSCTVLDVAFAPDRCMYSGVTRFNWREVKEEPAKKYESSDPAPVWPSDAQKRAAAPFIEIGDHEKTGHGAAMRDTPDIREHRRLWVGDTEYEVDPITGSIICPGCKEKDTEIEGLKESSCDWFNTVKQLRADLNAKIQEASAGFMVSRDSVVKDLEAEIERLQRDVDNAVGDCKRYCRALNDKDYEIGERDTLLDDMKTELAEVRAANARLVSRNPEREKDMQQVASLITKWRVFK